MRSRKGFTPGDQNSLSAHLHAEDDGRDRRRPPPHRAEHLRQVRPTEGDGTRARSEAAKTPGRF